MSSRYYRDYEASSHRRIPYSNVPVGFDGLTGAIDSIIDGPKYVIGGHVGGPVGYQVGVSVGRGVIVGGPVGYSVGGVIVGTPAGHPVGVVVGGGYGMPATLSVPVQVSNQTTINVQQTTINIQQSSNSHAVEEVLIGKSWVRWDTLSQDQKGLLHKCQRRWVSY